MTLGLIALVYALVASAIGWGVLLTVGRGIVPSEDRNRYIVAWGLFTILLFVSPNGSVFLVVAALLMVALRMTGAHPVALSVFLLSAIPVGQVPIFGLPFGINYLLTFTFALVLSMVLLTPVAVRSIGGGLSGLRTADVFAYLYLFLIFLLSFRDTTFTDGLRSGVVILFTALVPYFALSRSITDERILRRVVASLMASLVLCAMVGFLSSMVRWQIYTVPLREVFGVQNTPYIVRAGLLRTGGTLGGSPISFGVMTIVGAAISAGFVNAVKRKSYIWVIVAVMILGLLASVSRGPMVAGVIALVVYQFTTPKPAAGLAKLGALGVLAVPLALATGQGRALLNTLPFVSGEEDGSLNYRERLLEIGIDVVMKRPFFGTRNFKDEPEMQELVQGQGIIDVVNSYLRIALETGLVSLFFYLALFAVTLMTSLRVVRRLDPVSHGDLRLMGAGLFTALFSFAVVIATTSLTGVLGYLGWMLLGLNIAFVRVAMATLAAPVASRSDVAVLPQESLPTETVAPAVVPEQVAEVEPQAPRPKASFGLQSSPEDLPWLQALSTKPGQGT